MSRTHVAKPALAAVLMSLGLAGLPAWAEEAKQAEGIETSPAAAPKVTPGTVPHGFPAMPGMPGMHPAMPYGLYGMPRMLMGPFGAGPGMPYGSFAGPGAGPMMPAAPAMPARPDVDESIQERQKQIDERLGAFDPAGTPSRREYFKQRRQERKRQFEQRATGTPMGQGMPGMPSAGGPWGGPTPPAVPTRDAMDKAIDRRVRDVDAASRGMYPWGQARRDWYQARRQYKKDMWQRQFNAARAHSPGMMPHQPWGMMGPGARTANPWAPAPGEE